MNDMNILYYDIESLPELFSVALFKPGACAIYHLVDNEAFPTLLTPAQNEEIIAEVFRCNKNLDRNTKVSLFDLRVLQPGYYGDIVPAASLAYAFGTPDIRENILTTGYPIVKDTDLGYDENIHHYIAGYNNINYDMTMLAFYFCEVFMKGTGQYCSPVTPKLLREFNDELFDKNFKSYMPGRLRYEYLRTPDKYRNGKTVQIGSSVLIDRGWNNNLPYYKVYQYMNSTGRHLDVARLNEKAFRLALKRILGMLGYQIMEPETSLNEQAASKKHMTFETLKNTLAYNVSDVVQLSHLMEHKAYKGPFLLKKQMLKDYPAAVYKQKPIRKEEYTEYNKLTGAAETKQRTVHPYEPDIRPESVRPDRLTINASSAKLAAAALCPYGELNDLPVVDFNYPHPDKAKERNVPVINVLDTLENFVNNRMVPKVKSEKGQEIIDSIIRVIAMYRNLENKDFDGAHEEDNYVYDISKYAGTENVIYMGPDGEPTSCFATFSIGGIHGAEYNKALYEKDLEDFKQMQILFQKIKGLFPEPLNLVVTVNEKGKQCKRKTFEIDGTEYQVKDFLKSGYTMKKAQWKPDLENAKPPELFPLKGKKRKLSDRYAYTSFGEANHEDFTSYYPRMLSQMKAFFNRLMGRDPYEEIFQNKTKFGIMQKDPKYSETEQALYGNMRNGTKLVLNSASGAADTDHKTSIRMNNQIIKMRTIGQMYAFMIAQAQALEGAIVPSTNTDGIYTFMEEKLNNEILYREAAITGVEMEPERLYLVSKDTNNRVEVKKKGNTGSLLDDVKILGASGGTLAAYDGPNPEKSLDHPAILDWLLVWTLLNNALNKNDMGPYDEAWGDYLLKQAAPKHPFMKKDCPDFSDTRRFLIMFQHILSSSQGMHYYTFASKTPITDPMDQSIEPLPCQHHTRVFYVNPDNMPEDQKHRIRYMGCAYMMKLQKRDAASSVTREQESLSKTPSYPAIRVIRDFNADKEAMEQTDKIAKIKKLKGLATTQPCLIINDDLDYAEIKPEWLDYDAYNRAAKTSYHNSWENSIEGHTADTEETEEE